MSQRETLAGQSGKYSVDFSRPFAYGRISVPLSGDDFSGMPICVRLFRKTPKRRDAPFSSREFLRELKAQGRLKHPNILPVIDSGLVDEHGEPFIIKTCGLRRRSAEAR